MPLRTTGQDPSPTIDPAEARRVPLGPDYVRLWLATAITNIGDGLRATALPLLAVAISDQPLAIAGILFASKLPWLVLALHAGAMVDRFDRARLIVFTNIVRAIVVGAFALSVQLDLASLPMLYLLAVLQGIGEVFSDSAAFALLPRLVPAGTLERANGRLEAAVITTNEFAGPALGGVMFAVGAGMPFALDSISFLCAAVLITGIPSPTIPATRPQGSVRRQIKEGWRWLLDHPLMRNLSLIAALTNLWLHASFAIAVLFAARILGLGPIGFGLLLSVEAAGALAGSLAASRLRVELGARRTIMIALLAAGSANIAIALSSDALIVGMLAMAVSFGGGLWNVVTNSLRQQCVPDHLLGRVQSAHRLMSWGAIPVGTLLGGVLAQGFGLRAPFALAGISLCLLSLVAARAIADGPIPEGSTQGHG